MGCFAIDKCKIVYRNICEHVSVTMLQLFQQVDYDILEQLHVQSTQGTTK